MILRTAGLNGTNRFSAVISTDTVPRLVAASADVEIHADLVLRGFMLGRVAPNARMVKRVRIENVPAASLIRIGSPSNPRWSARIVSAIDRSVEVELTAALPSPDAGMSEQRNDCEFSLFFSNADVRPVQVLVAAIAASGGRDGDASASESDVAGRER